MGWVHSQHGAWVSMQCCLNSLRSLLKRRVLRPYDLGRAMVAHLAAGIRKALPIERKGFRVVVDGSGLVLGRRFEVEIYVLRFGVVCW